VVVVDRDVNIDDPHEIEWAIAMRFQADRDFVVVSGAHSSKLDPSSDGGISAKIGIDATKPVEAESLVFKRIHVRGEEDVELEPSLQRDSRTAPARIIGTD
jgi:2,5-furandicarboxylate decarboxylase 1